MTQPLRRVQRMDEAAAKAVRDAAWNKRQSLIEAVTQEGLRTLGKREGVSGSLDTQIKTARAEMGERRWHELNAEWEQ